MTITSKKLSLEEFLKLPNEDGNYELIEGEAVPKMAPQLNHSRLTIALCILLRNWAKNRGELGIEWGVILKRNNLDWVPIPDLSYISSDKLKEELSEGFCPQPPELAIEIVSPGQSFGSLIAKATDYLEAGVERVWIVDSQSQTVTVFYPNRPSQTKKGSDSLEDVILPGLKLTVEEIFREAGLI